MTATPWGEDVILIDEIKVLHPLEYLDIVELLVTGLFCEAFDGMRLTRRGYMDSLEADEMDENYETDYSSLAYRFETDDQVQLYFFAEDFFFKASEVLAHAIYRMSQAILVATDVYVGSLYPIFKDLERARSYFGRVYEEFFYVEEDQICLMALRSLCVALIDLHKELRSTYWKKVKFPKMVGFHAACSLVSVFVRSAPAGSVLFGIFDQAVSEIRSISQRKKEQRASLVRLLNMRGNKKLLEAYSKDLEGPLF